MESHKSTHSNKVPSAKAWDQRKQKAKKTNPWPRPPKSKPSPKAKKWKANSDCSASEGHDDDEPTTLKSKKQSCKKKCQCHQKSISSAEEVEDGDSSKDEVEVVDEGHSDGHESDEVCMERVLVLIGWVDVTGWSAGATPCWHTRYKANEEGHQGFTHHIHG